MDKTIPLLLSQLIAFLFIHEKVKKELDDLEQQEIIAKFEESTPWVTISKRVLIDSVLL